MCFDGATDLGAATISGGNWSFTTGPLPDGSHSFTAKATDTAGNVTTNRGGDRDGRHHQSERDDQQHDRHRHRRHHDDLEAAG